MTDSKEQSTQTVQNNVRGVFYKKVKDSWGNWIEIEVPILSIEIPRNIRGKVSDGNWAVDYETTSPLGGTGKRTQTEYFFKKVDAQNWIQKVLNSTPKQP